MRVDRTDCLIEDRASKYMLFLVTDGIVTLLEAFGISPAIVVLAWSWNGSNTTFAHWQNSLRLLLSRPFQWWWRFTFLRDHFFKRHLNTLLFLIVLVYHDRSLFASFLDLIYVIFIIIRAFRKRQILFLLHLLFLLWIDKILNHIRVWLILGCIILIHRVAFCSLCRLRHSILPILYVTRMIWRLLILHWWLTTEHELLIIVRGWHHMLMCSIMLMVWVHATIHWVRLMLPLTLISTKLVILLWIH